MGTVLKYYIFIITITSLFSFRNSQLISVVFLKYLCLAACCGKTNRQTERCHRAAKTSIFVRALSGAARISALIFSQRSSFVVVSVRVIF